MEQKMNRQEFLSAVEELIEMDPGTLKGDEVLDSLEGWDSLAVITFIALVDESLGMILEGDKLADTTTMAELMAMVEHKLN
jgi:acyl carrier protein